MAGSQVTTVPSGKQPQDIMCWLLAILKVVNAGGKLAPQEAVQKLLRELVDTYGSGRVWQGIKQFSTTFDMADASIVEVLFHRHRDLPSVLKSEEGQTALSQWFDENSARVDQVRRLFHALGRLTPITTTSKFAEGAADAEQRELLAKVSDILTKEGKQ